MTRAYVEAPATHYRLSDETWAIIAEEYRDGATAKDIGAKWKVAPSSVYRHACQDGWTKKGMGDVRARAHARMVEAEEEAARALHPVGSRALKGLFAPERKDSVEEADPAVLARLATLASGRAMTGRLWSEARALSQLAEAYGRLASRQEAGRVTLDTVPLELVARIAVGPQDHWIDRMNLFDADENEPDYEVRASFWRRKAVVDARRQAELESARRAGFEEGRREVRAEGDAAA